MTAGTLPRALDARFLGTVEAAAEASARTIGLGDRHRSDEVAVEAMRRALGEAPVRGRIVAGEGERDEAPMLWVGEEVGARGPGDADFPEVDIAVDPLEGTNLCATGSPGAVAVLAASGRGGLLTAPDIYMEKIMVGPAARGLLGSEVTLDRPTGESVRAIAGALGLPPGEITVAVLDRPRHEALIAGVREAGARVRLISDGDLTAGILAARPGSGIHAAMGSGGSPEGVLAAAALRCLGGGMLARLVIRGDADRRRLSETGVGDPDRIYDAEALAPGPDLAFYAAGVTSGPLADGVAFGDGSATVASLCLRNDPREESRVIRRVAA